MKIAVIGAGVSGLVSAYLLGERHEVTLLEADRRLGGHVNTVCVPHSSGSLPIDTGFIVYNSTNYPLFSRLLEKLQVATQPTVMSFGVCDENTSIEYSGRSFDTLFAQRSLLLQPDHWRMLADIRRFMQHASEQVEAAPNDELAVFVSRYRYSRPFAERFLIPLASALWSSSSLGVQRFPARFVVEFLDHHGMLRLNNRPQWRVITGGSSRYLEKLLKATRASIQKGSPVIGIERTECGVIVHTATDSTTFDEVIVACHSDQALELLHNPSREECAILSRIRYQENEVVLHTDTSVLPRNRKTWASWNVRALAGSNSVAAITYNMNLLQGLTTEETYCVSLNQTDQINPEAILGTFCYHHPIASLEAEAAKKRRHELIRHHRVSYCGAYWGYGFHEDGTRSAYEVWEAFA